MAVARQDSAEADKVEQLTRLAQGIRHHAQAFLKAKRDWRRKAAKNRAAREAALRNENRVLKRLLALKRPSGVPAQPVPVRESQAVRGIGRTGRPGR